MTADPEAIRMWASRDKCFMCKRKFSTPVILPTKSPERDKFQPNFNFEVIFHLHDTHGIPSDISRKWIIGHIYGLDLTIFGACGLEELYDEVNT